MVRECIENAAKAAAFVPKLPMLFADDTLQVGTI